MMIPRWADRQSMIVTHSGQRGSGLISKYGYHSAFSSRLSARVTDWLAPPPQKHSLSAVCWRYRPTASRRPQANPSRARQWTLPLSTTSPARATRSRRSRLHRGKPRRLSSKRSARDHQRLPCTEWCHAAACLASAFPYLSPAAALRRANGATGRQRLKTTSGGRTATFDDRHAGVRYCSIQRLGPHREGSR